MRNFDVNRFSQPENDCIYKEGKDTEEMKRKEKLVFDRAKIMIVEGHELVKEIETRMKNNIQQNFAGLNEEEKEDISRKTGFDRDLIDSIIRALEERETSH